MDNSLTIIIPTIGRDTLSRTLDSIVSQRLQPNDQILVCYDSYPGREGDLLPRREMTKSTVESFGPQFEFHEHDGGANTWGNDQRNAMIPKATSDWVLFQDDDDIFCPGALDTIRFMGNLQVEKGSDLVPMYFRFEGPNGALFWRNAGEVTKNTIGGHCIVAPRGARLAVWGKGYTGDWDYVARTSMNYKDLGYWYPHILSMHKPPLGWIEVTTYDQAEVMRLIRNECRATLTRNRDEISPEQQKTWFEGRDLARTFPYLFYAGDNVIGYGMLSVREDNLPWVTVCVLPNERGKRYGRTIFKLLSYGFALPVYAEISRDNIPSLKACLGAGYEVEEATLRTTILRSKCQDRPLEDKPR